MQIANPIYDVVFKYLMEDNDIAKLLLSTIIGQEIVALDFLPQERTIMLKRQSFTVYRLDFSATIKMPDKSRKLVIIEIQKAKFAADIMRFRRYLGAQYQNKENSYTTVIHGKTTKVAMPIVSIYFLGYPLQHTTAPVIKVARTYCDVTTGQEVQVREEFIESLTHDSFVIQIPHLHPDRKTDIEQLLSIFDQHRATSNAHILRINEDEYPARYRPVIRRLQRAIAEPDVQETMDAEDDILQELEEMEHVIGEQSKALGEKDKALEEKDKALEEKDKALEEKDNALEEKDNALGEKDRLIEELRKRLEIDE